MSNITLEPRCQAHRGMPGSIELGAAEPYLALTSTNVDLDTTSMALIPSTSTKLPTTVVPST